MRPGGKKPSKYSRSTGKQKKDEKRQFTRKRDSQTTILEKDIEVITNNAKLQGYYAQALGTFRVTGKDARMQAVRTSIKATKEFAEEQGIKWELPK